MYMPVVVSDSSPLVALSDLGILHILPNLYGQIFVPSTVWEELEAGPKSASRQFLLAQTWIVVCELPSMAPPVQLHRRLDRGEEEAIRLAITLSADLLIVDDRAARMEATSRGFPIIGTLGLLRAAKEGGLIDAVKPYLLRLQDELGFRTSEEVIAQVLLAAQEI